MNVNKILKVTKFVKNKKMQGKKKKNQGGALVRPNSTTPLFKCHCFRKLKNDLVRLISIYIFAKFTLIIMSKTHLVNVY